MMNLNATGNLTKDAETRNLSDNSVTSFTVAVNSIERGEKKTTYIDCALWGSRGEKLRPHLTKGTTVSVNGTPRIRQYEHNGTHRAELQIRVNELGLHGGRTTEGEYKKPHQADYNAPADDLNSDEIPF